MNVIVATTRRARKSASHVLQMQAKRHATRCHGGDEDMASRDDRKSSNNRTQLARLEQIWRANGPAWGEDNN
jgi:hypothetical protein